MDDEGRNKKINWDEMSFHFMGAAMYTNEVTHSFQMGNYPSLFILCVESRL